MLIYENKGILSKNIRFMFYAIAALLLSVLQPHFLDLINIGGITPDLMLLLAIWIAVKEGRFIGIIAAFGIGLLLDITAIDVPGTNALTKTIAAFIAGSFHIPGKTELTIGKPKFILIAFFASVVHNLLYNLFYIKFGEFDTYNFIIRFGLAFSIYTSVFAIFPMILAKPMKRWE